MNKFFLLLTAALLTMGQLSYSKELVVENETVTVGEITGSNEYVVEDEISEEIIPIKEKEKKISFSTGASYKNRQQGMIDQKGYEYGQPDDFDENGDVTQFFTKLGYKINDKWSAGYKYGYKYVDNQEANGYGKYVDENGHVKDGKDNGFESSNAFSLTRHFDDLNAFGKVWTPSITGTYEYLNHSGYGTYDSSEGKSYGNDGYSRNRIILNGRVSSQLTENTKMNLSYEYQYRNYNYDNSASDSNQQRHYVTADVYHQLTEKTYIDISNTLYYRTYDASAKNTGEWDYDYTLGYKTSLKNGVIYNPTINTWGELSLWENGTTGSTHHNQSEVVFYPLMFKKSFDLGGDMSIDPFVGAGYTYGWDTQTGTTIYDGAEAKAGFVFNAKL